jgi:hypothetical protein
VREAKGSYPFAEAHRCAKARYFNWIVWQLKQSKIIDRIPGNNSRIKRSAVQPSITWALVMNAPSRETKNPVPVETLSSAGGGSVLFGDAPAA